MQAVLASSECSLYRCLLELLFTTGLRIGEALGLAVGDLDTKNSVIRVECQLGRDGTRSPLKTEESRRAIDIPPQLMRRLVALTRERGTTATRRRSCSRVVTAAASSGRSPAKRSKRAVAKAGITAPAPTLHDLRHSHASMLIALDVSIVEIQRRLGHRKSDTTLRIYAHEWKYSAARRGQVGRQRPLRIPRAADASGTGAARASACRRHKQQRRLSKRLREREFVGGVGELVHEGGFHFIDRGWRERVRSGDFAPLAGGLRDLGEHASGLIRI